MTTVIRFFVLAAALVLAGFTPGSLAAQTAEAPETIVLKGPTQGAVTFTHARHAELGECASCHHESKPEKAKTSDNQKCTECHTKPAEAPMKTVLRDAFHNAMGKQGVCIDCHVKSAAEGKAAEGKTVPLKCAECHVK